jgi:hypothetical protein
MTSRDQHQNDRPKNRKQGSQPRFKRRYSMSVEACQALYESQRGACGSCHQPFQGDIYVDRDRVTRRLRSLLCHRCDSAVRFLEENPHFPAQADRFFSECPEAESCIATRERSGESCDCLRMRAKLQSTLEVWPYGAE